MAHTRVDGRLDPIALATEIRPILARNANRLSVSGVCRERIWTIGERDICSS